MAGRFLAATALVLLLAGCSTEPVAPPGAPPASPSATPPDSPPTEPPAEAPMPHTLPAFFDHEFSGGDLRLGAVRERTSRYTSYDVTYRSEDLTISGVLNVPAGPGPFPAVVLAHGYIDPAVYVRGQGMTRERTVLAQRGYVALHVDYRNHADSDRDPGPLGTFRLGYAIDVINAVHALLDSDQVAVDPERVAMIGRSMGGSVVQQALVMSPGLVQAGVVFASVSSDAWEYVSHFRGESFWDEAMDHHGLTDPAAFAEALSPINYFDRISEPVLSHHGRSDDVCPPRWATATQRAMRAAGVDSRLRWWDDGHAFGPAFPESMEVTMRFLERR
ncbi:alpha/beta hydrolase family protein [Nocardioides limicola]|uniref:alpha/beta hydrolase family protein n=1 Tax=Nocardioides limicola TaxID=2803368 RepID=UPI00193BEC12|nr:alpha/beta fold hydrolase [Nocardioides sp. DJM-14]